MTYQSLFDELDKGLMGNNDYFRGRKDDLCYLAIFKELLSELQSAVSVRTPDSDFENLEKRVFHPPRVIRKLLDHKLGTKRDTSYLAEGGRLFCDALQIGLRTYRGEDTSALIAKLERGIGEMDEDLLFENVYQPPDKTTFTSSAPNYSVQTARNIQGTTTQQDLLFIALAHGGVAAGMDVFLRYCALADSRDSEFYVVRFSRCKKLDHEPRLNEREREMLREKAERKEIIVFDEDSWTGGTINIAAGYFGNLFQRRVMCFTNLHP